MTEEVNENQAKDILKQQQVSNFNDLIEKIRKKTFSLYQNTSDTAQLSPIERLNSIKKVWDFISNKLGNIQTALDVWSGFWYGIKFLSMNWIRVIGVENVWIKVMQSLELFDDLLQINTLDFDKSPAIFETNFSKLKDENVVDIITMFYLSIELISISNTFEVCKKILKQKWKILLTTQANKNEVEEYMKGINLKTFWFSIEIIDIPNNFERTAILLIKEN
jgi:hypothetical protein